MTITVRLDVETERALSRLMRQSGNTRSEVVRQALVRLVMDRKQRKEPPPYELIHDLVGRARGGPPDLSTRTGEQLRRLFANRSRGNTK